MNRRTQTNRRRAASAPGKQAPAAAFFTTKSCALLLLVLAAAVARPLWQGLKSYRLIRTTDTHLKQLIRLEGPAVYRDEVLAMSAQMAAATGDLKWVRRYDESGRRIRPEVNERWDIS